MARVQSRRRITKRRVKETEQGQALETITEILSVLLSHCPYFDYVEKDFVKVYKEKHVDPVQLLNDVKRACSR